MIKIINYNIDERDIIYININMFGTELKSTATVRNKKIRVKFEFEHVNQIKFINNLLDDKYNKTFYLHVSNGDNCLQLNENFPWDIENKKIISQIIRDISNAKFKKSVVDTGLLHLYKRYKKQGAKLMAKQYVRNIYDELPYTFLPYIFFKNRDEKIIFDKRYILTSSKYYYTRKYKSQGVVFTCKSINTFIQKLDKYFLCDYLEIKPE